MFNFIIDNRNMKLKKSNSDLGRIVMLRFMFTDSYISDLPAINTHLLQTSRLKVLFGRIRNGLSRIKFFVNTSVSCIINLAHVNTLWMRYFTLMREDMSGKVHPPRRKPSFRCRVAPLTFIRS